MDLLISQGNSEFPQKNKGREWSRNWTIFFRHPAVNTWTEVTVISTANKTNSIHSLIDLHFSYLLKVLEKTGLEEIIRVE